MVGLCFAENCTTNSGTFYELPLEPNRRIKWLACLGKTTNDANNFLSNSTGVFSNKIIICENHFSESQFEIKNGTRHMKDNSVPDKKIGTKNPVVPDLINIKHGCNKQVEPRKGEKRKPIMIPKIPIQQLVPEIPTQATSPQKIQPVTIPKLIPVPLSPHAKSVTQNLKSGALILPKIPTSTVIKPQIPLITKSSQDFQLAKDTGVLVTPPNRGLLLDCNKILAKKPRLLAPKPYIPVSKLCRICAENKEPTINIYGEQGKRLELPRKITNSLQVKLNPDDRLPLKICLECIEKVQYCHEIINNCAEANKKLLHLCAKEKEENVHGNLRNKKPIQLILIENDARKGPANISSEYRVINEKLVHVDKSLPPPQQIAQVIETVKAGFNNSNNQRKFFLPSPPRSESKQPVNLFKCLLCKEKLTDKFELIQHQLLKYQCRTCKIRFCTTKTRRTHYRTFHLDKRVSISCSNCNKQFRDSTSLHYHKLAFHPYFCECCSKAFGKKSALINHFKYKLNLKFKCKKCKQEFQDYVDYSKHSKSCMFNVCKYCNQKFKDFEEFKIHEKIHTKFHCNVCNKSFKNRNTLKWHSKFHNEKLIQCPLCPRQFVINTELKYHLEVHANERKFECDFCGSKFLHRQHLIKHIQTIHLQNRCYKCNLCEEKYTIKEDADKHFETEHSIEEKITVVSPFTFTTPFKCDSCNKCFSNKYCLDLHNERHTNKELGIKYMCEICGATYTSKPGLKCHLKRHSSEHLKSESSNLSMNVKRYECKMCHLRYSTTSQLLAHVSNHTGVKPFKCSICESTFTTKVNRDSHELKHKGIKNFSCSYCEKSFYKNYNLLLHMRTHTKEKPYSCSVCLKKFPRRSNLTTHLRTHTGDKPFLCSICGNGFTQKSSLDKHLTLHTMNKLFKCDHCDFSSNKHQVILEHIEMTHQENDFSKHIEQVADEAEFQIQLIEQEVITYT